jgi:rhodanese-related sulfurtransferase
MSIKWKNLNMIKIDVTEAYNELPALPPRQDIETKKILKVCIEARASLAELRKAAEMLPNQSVLINSLPLLEAQAATKLLDENPDLEVYSLEGGLMAWKEAGFPTHRASCAVLGLERQTQIAAGSLVLSGTLLGVAWHPAFFFLSGFVGAGLIVAGLSGWCGMAKLLAKMPWNQ